ncbi:MAG: heavy metal-binding domain-containing protein [Candidatus Desantisbacteria bacterium]
MNNKRMIIWIVVAGITTLLASSLYAGACGMSGMMGGGSCGQHEEKHQAAVSEKVKCAYDGMEMDKKEMKASMRYKGKKLYFCTKNEMKEFKKDPQAYLSGGKKGTMTTTTEPNAQYTCPMHPEVISDKPGNCPKCGMNLVKKK